MRVNAENFLKNSLLQQLYHSSLNKSGRKKVTKF